MDLPLPVSPTSATVLPAGMMSEKFCRMGASGEYPKVMSLSSIAPCVTVSSGASGASSKEWGGGEQEKKAKRHGQAHPNAQAGLPLV